MTIRRGETWGEAVRVPAGVVEVSSDAALGQHLAGGRGTLVHVVGGDLWRSLGRAGRRDTVQQLPIDLLCVVADGHERLAVAHVVARGASWWRGPILAVLNVDRLGRWDAAPRAHPNDGFADVIAVDAALGLRARWQASRRLSTGSHLPHPLITTTRVTDATWSFEPARRLWIDGVACGPVRELAIAIAPDAAVVLV